jgi:hypothetical protein
MKQKHKKNGVSKFFDRFSSKVTKITGKPVAFILACVVVVVWAVTGANISFFRYMATGNKYRHNHYYFFKSVCNSTIAKQRHNSAADKAE